MATAQLEGYTEFDFTPRPMAAKSAQVEDDTYLVKLVKIGAEREEDNNFKPGEKRWVQDYTFEIIKGESTEDKFEGKELVYKLNPKINMGYLEGARKSKLYPFLKAILGAPPEGVGRFTSNDLIGRLCKVDVENNEKGYSNITSVSKYAKQPAFEGKGASKPLFDEKGDELPIDKPAKKVANADEF